MSDTTTEGTSNTSLEQLQQPHGLTVIIPVTPQLDSLFEECLGKCFSGRQLNSLRSTCLQLSSVVSSSAGLMVPKDVIYADKKHKKHLEKLARYDEKLGLVTKKLEAKTTELEDKFREIELKAQKKEQKALKKKGLGVGVADAKEQKKEKKEGKKQEKKDKKKLEKQEKKEKKEKKKQEKKEKKNKKKDGKEPKKDKKEAKKDKKAKKAEKKKLEKQDKKDKKKDKLFDRKEHKEKKYLHKKEKTEKEHQEKQAKKAKKEQREQQKRLLKLQRSNGSLSPRLKLETIRDLIGKRDGSISRFAPCLQFLDLPAGAQPAENTCQILKRASDFALQSETCWVRYLNRTDSCRKHSSTRSCISTYEAMAKECSELGNNGLREVQRLESIMSRARANNSSAGSSNARKVVPRATQNNSE